MDHYLNFKLFLKIIVLINKLNRVKVCLTVIIESVYTLFKT